MPAQAVETLRCSSRVVSLDDDGAKVLSVCGEPSFRDRWTRDPGLAAPFGITELWYYNFGPDQLLYVLRFDKGRLRTIDTDGYGFWRSRDDGRCTSAQILEGLSKYRLLQRCGEPVQRHAFDALRQPVEQNRIYRGYKGEAQRSDYVQPVHHETWIYDFGARSEQQRVILEDGWVTDVSDQPRSETPAH